MKTNTLHKILVAITFVFFSQMSNGQIYTATFTQGQAALAADVTAWTNFRASLVAGTYTRMELFSNLNPGKICNDPATCLIIAVALRNGTNTTASFGGITWRTSTGCGADIEFSADGSFCNCLNPGYTLRPGIGNSNWGGIGSATCSGITQTITVRFTSVPPVIVKIVTTDTIVCAGAFGRYKVAKDPGTVFNWTVPVGWTVLSGLGTDSIYVQYANNSGTVSVNGTNGAGTGNTVTKAITVIPYTIITFNTVPQTCTSSANNILIAIPAGGVFSGPGVSNGIFYPGIAGVGTHTLKYTYTNNSGCVTISTQQVAVLPGPTVTQSPFANICESGSPLTLFGGNPVGGTYSGPGVNAGIFDPAVAGAGTHNIIYAYTGFNGCIGKDTITITVTTPTVGFNAIGPFCSSTPLMALSAGTPNGGSYSGNGVINSYDFDAATAGVGSHLLTYTYMDNNGCINTDTQTVVVNALSTVTFTPPVGACNNAGAFALTGGMPIGGIYSGVGVSNGMFNPQVVGAGQVTYTYTNPITGCPNSDTQTITIDAVPATAGTITGPPNTICQGQLGVNFMITSIPTATGYNWAVPPGANIVAGMNTNSITIDFSNIAISGTIAVSASNACGNGSVSPSFGITVDPLPIANFTFVSNQGVATFTNTSQYATNVLWNFGDGSPTSVSINPLHIFPANNTYSVSLTATNSCGSDTFVQQIVSSGVGIEEEIEGQRVSIYPNPTKDNLNIKLEGSSLNSLEIKLMSANGQLVYHENVSKINGAYIKTIDLSKNAKGIYFIQFISNKQVITRKVVIE